MDNKKDFLTRAKILEDQDRFELAVEQYDRMIESGLGEQAIAHQRKSRALTRLGCFDEALEECQKALALNPDLHLAHGVLGYIYFRQEKYDLAENEFLTALRLQPDDIVALNNLVSIYSNLGRYQEATAMCERVTKHQPENLDRQIHLVKLYLVQNRFQRVLKELNKVVVRRPLVFKVYPIYVAALVQVGLRYFGQLSIWARLGALAGFYLVALLAPPVVSVPIGITLSIFTLIIIAANLWFRSYKYKGKNRTVFMLFIFGFYCVFYWIAVLLRMGL